MQAPTKSPANPWPRPVILNGYEVHNHTARGSADLVASGTASAVSLHNTGPGSALGIVEGVAEIGSIERTGAANADLIAQCSAIDEASTNYTPEARADLIADLEDSFTARVAGVDVAMRGRLQVKGARVLNFEGDDVAGKSKKHAGGADANGSDSGFGVVIATNPPFFEIGNVLGELAILWHYTRDDIVRQWITTPAGREEIDPALRSYVIPGPILNSTEVTIEGLDSTGLTATATTEARAMARQFWGKSSVEILTEADVKALSGSVLSDGFVGPLEFSVSASPEYMYVAAPVVWGEIPVILDPVTSVRIPTQAAGVVQITNDYGYDILYRVFRGVNPTAGAFPWVLESTSGARLPDPAPPTTLHSLRTDAADILRTDAGDTLRTE